MPFSVVTVKIASFSQIFSILLHYADVVFFVWAPLFVFLYVWVYSLQ